MVRSLLLRGMLVGLIGGLLGFGVARAVGEPQVRKAIAFEEYVDNNVHHTAGETAVVSRSVQETIGLGTGAVLAGVALGGIFALVFAAAYGRMGTMTARGTAAVLGLLGFVGVCLVPFLKYPANPPSVGDPDTIGKRTALYLVMIALAVAGIVLAIVVRNSLIVRFGEWNSTLIAGAGYIVFVALCYLVLPGVNEVPQAAMEGVVGAVTDARTTFPPTVLWRFRVASLAIQATIWTTIAVGFGALAGRLFNQEATQGLALDASRVPTEA